MLNIAYYRRRLNCLGRIAGTLRQTAADLLIDDLVLMRIQPRVFILPQQQRRRFGDSMPDEEGFGYEAPIDAVRVDEQAEAAELVAMGTQLTKLLAKENENAADELKAALAEFETTIDDATVTETG